MIFCKGETYFHEVYLCMNTLFVINIANLSCKSVKGCSPVKVISFMNVNALFS